MEKPIKIRGTGAYYEDECDAKPGYHWELNPNYKE